MQQNSGGTPGFYKETTTALKELEFETSPTVIKTLHVLKIIVEGHHRLINKRSRQLEKATNPTVLIAAT